LRFVARAPRSGFGRVVKLVFWLVLLAPPLLMLGTCAGLSRFLLSEDEEVAMGALLFGAEALGWLWACSIIGVPVLLVLTWLTRGRRLVIERTPPG
jgi:hypothetical protein